MRSEIERAMAYVARANLRRDTPNVFAADFSERPIKILPPFCGEMGFEVIHFLARVEPYLRNGWRILARRPALYPAGTAFYDPEYFAKLDQLIVQYNLHSSELGLRQPNQRLDGNFHVQVSRADMQQIELLMRYEMPDILIQESRFELQQRDLFYSYCDVAKRGVIDLDTMLLSCQATRLNDMAIAGRPVLRPGYLPHPFLKPELTCHPHIGVQLRAMGKTGKHPGPAASRDSDPAVILPLAEKVAAHLGLPILIYGRPGGNVLPEGYDHTYEPEIDLLNKEMQWLRSCRVMFAPDSGWADLMAWLQVPTLLEGSVTSGHFDALIDFQPRIMLIDYSQSIETQMEKLLATEFCIPGDTLAEQNHSESVETKLFLTLS